MENVETILSQALATIEPSFTKIRVTNFGDDDIYYAGDIRNLLPTDMIAILQDQRPSEAAQSLTKLCLEQIKERGATLITLGDVKIAADMVSLGGRVIILLSQGIKKADLRSVMAGVRSGNALIMSLSERDPSDAESIQIVTRLLSALCHCSFVAECKGGTWNERTLRWNNFIMNECQEMANYGKTIFIAPWHRGHPAQHLVIKHEFGAVDLPESEDPANVFSFIPESLPDVS